MIFIIINFICFNAVDLEEIATLLVSYSFKILLFRSRENGIDFKVEVTILVTKVSLLLQFISFLIQQDLLCGSNALKIVFVVFVYD